MRSIFMNQYLGLMWARFDSSQSQLRLSLSVKFLEIPLFADGRATE